MRANGLIGVVQLVLILLVGSPGSRFGMLLGTTASCGFMSTNKRTSSEAMEFFNTEVDQNFVGQYKAVQNLRGALHDHLEMGNGPLVLHLVGPSGTGKSYLTELMSKAVFDDCKDVTSQVLGGMRAVVTGALDSLPSVFDGWGFKSTGKDLVQRATRRKCPPKQRLDDWRQACGIVYTSFHDDTAETGGGNHKVLSQFLEAAAQELKIEPNSVLIMDDFNFCKRDCGTMLKDLLSQHIVRTRSGEVVSASKAVIVFCSDLTNMGLVLDSSLDYDNALKLVEESAETFWGSDSVVITKSIHLPFAPLRPAEFTRIIDSIIRSTQEVVKARVRKYLPKPEDELPYEWNGRMICDESTKQQIVDRLHGQTEVTNARAITEVFKEKLRLRVLKPTPIEKRLGGFTRKNSVMGNNKDIQVKIQPGTSELVLILEIQ